MHYFSKYALIIMLVLFVAALATTSGVNAGADGHITEGAVQSENPPYRQDADLRTRLAESSDPHAILVDAFYNSGWSSETAVLLAENAFARLGVDGYEVKPAPNAPTADVTRIDVLGTPLPPDTDPMTILVDAFHIGGWTMAEAYVHAHNALGRFGAPGFKQKKTFNPAAALVASFHASGWSLDDSVAHSHNALARIGAEGYTFRPAPESAAENRTNADRSLLAPGSDPLAILTDVFHTRGLDADEAFVRAKSELMKIGVAALESNPLCQVRRVVIQYCDPQKKTWTGYVFENCYEQLFLDVTDPENPIELCAVPAGDLGDVPWHTMTMKGNCALAYDGCVRIHFGVQRSINCNNSHILDCDCFHEQSCQAIETVQHFKRYDASTGSGGCPGCPCDS